MVLKCSFSSGTTLEVAEPPGRAFCLLPSSVAAASGFK